MGNAGYARALLWFIAFTALVHTGPAEAARQGSLGGTSSGSISITVSVPAQARVSVADIELASTDSDGVLTGSQEICVTSNSLARSFTVAAVGSGSEGSLELSNGSRAVAYSVRWSSPESRGRGSPPWMTLPTASVDASSSGEPDCRSGLGLALLTVAVEDSRLGRATPAGPYGGALTLMLSPL